MDAFIIANAACCLTTGVLLYGAVKHMRYLLVKPSILFLIMNYCIVQVPSLLYVSKTYTEMAWHWDYFILAQLFPLFVLLFSVLSFTHSAVEIWGRLQENGFQFEGKIAGAYLIVTLVIVAAYLQYVGITNTGMYAILFNPENANWARERSLKLLDSQLLKYAYAVMASAILPVLAAILALRLPAVWKKKPHARCLSVCAGLLACFVFISFPGNRWGMLVLVLTIFTAVSYRSQFKFIRLSNLLILALLLLVVMVGITAMREGADLSQVDIWDYFFALNEEDDVTKGYGGLFWVAAGRAFLVPMKVGWDYLSYVENYGYWGIGGIAKAAMLVGVEPIDVSNLMCQYVYPSSEYRFVGTYPAGFIFSYYSYFGMSSIWGSFALIVLLDVLVVVYRRLNQTLLIPVMATVAIAITSLTSADYSTALISSGVVSSIVIALIVQEVAAPFTGLAAVQLEKCQMGKRLKKLWPAK